MKHIFKSAIAIVLFILSASGASAQVKPNIRHNQSPADSLWLEFNNAIYYTYYMSYRKNITTFTILKVDINKQGKVTGINFSDHTDTTFVHAWRNKENIYDDKATLGRYAKLKRYKDISLLIPISYQPNYPVSGKVFSYDEMNALMMFNKQNFSGRAIIFNLIKITTLASGDM